MLSVANNHIAKCRYAYFRYAECLYAECHGTSPFVTALSYKHKKFAKTIIPDLQVENFRTSSLDRDRFQMLKSLTCPENGF
jgi:hypothetical protein